MSKKNIKSIDAAFKKQLLEALEQVHENQIRQAKNDEEKFRADFLHTWHFEWIMKDLSIINPTARRT